MLSGLMAECRWLLLATPWSEADVGAMTVGLVLEQKEEGGVALSSPSFQLCAQLPAKHM